MSGLVQRLARALQACGDAAKLVEGRRLHAEVERYGLEGDLFLGKHIFHMYLKCRSIVDARNMFDKIGHVPNVILWTSMITAYAQNGHLDQGMQLFRRMQLEGVEPNKVTFLAVLGICRNSWQGSRLRAMTAEAGIEWDSSVATALVGMYMRCGEIQIALEIFEQIPERNVVSWSVAMGGCKQQPEQALLLFRKMQMEGILPDKITFVNLLNACALCGQSAASLHSDMVTRFNSEVESNVIVGTALLNMFAKCGKLEESFHIFSRMKNNRNEVSWTALITACCENHQHEKAMQTFAQMQQEGVRPSAVVFVNLLNAVSDSSSGCRVHQLILENGVDDVNSVLGNSIVNMYGKCGRLDKARQQFDKLVRMNSGGDLILWNGMFAAYGAHGMFTDALMLFTRMQLEGAKPNRTTFASILPHSRRAGRALSRADSYLLGLIQLLSAAEAEFFNSGNEDNDEWESDVVAWTAAIADYAEQGRFLECKALFRRMQLQGVLPTEVTLASILYACDLKEGFLLHQIILDSGIPIDVSIGTALINLYGRFHLPDDAYRVFVAIDEQISSLSWAAMIQCYAANHRSAQALGIYRQMQLQGVKPIARSFITALAASSQMMGLREIREIHACVRESDLRANCFVNNTLLSAFGKCGTLQEAAEVFEHCDPLRTATWSSIIAAFARHGCSVSALRSFHRMQQEGAKPDQITLLCLLAACSHGGLTDKAVACFARMSHDHGMSPAAEHCSCLADSLARAGRLDDAQELIRKMPIQPLASSWMTLLSACRIQGDVQRAELASAQIGGVSAQNYLLLANTYACPQIHCDSSAEAARDHLDSVVSASQRRGIEEP